MAASHSNEKDASKQRTFKTVSSDELEKIFNNRKAKSTQDVTKLWINGFKAFLVEKNLPEADNLSNEDALHLFYPSV